MSRQRPGGIPQSYSCLLIAGVVLVVIVGAILLIIYLRRHANAPKTGPAPAPPVAGALPEMATKPRPTFGTFKGCPAEGDGGDPALNELKNRTDEGQYVPVNFDAVANLKWPPAVERRARANWSKSDAGEVARYEGLPVSVEGYLASSKQEGPESPNCHGADADFRDYHIWLVPQAEADRAGSIVVEMTPPVRANHPNWRTDVLGQIAKKDLRVRVGGWLLLDPEHPDQVGKTRATIWEIHPVMRLDVQQNGKWVALDDFKP
ncbi:MAG: hypothetical protein M3268_07390 [Acidobacteriota bacterium]|nr:hypothetical protein [Acidobacteriota bacterium]